MESFELPKNFLMGSATSATQIEGGDQNNSWYRWCQSPGHIHDGSDCSRGADHWNRYPEDIQIMKELHHDVYRMGLEWSRIEPESGRYDETAIRHYRDEITLLLRNNIKPLVTLHHFSNPLWLEDRGGWENPDTVASFVRFTRYVLNELGDLVSEWITINEPNVFLIYGYARGAWPPGKTNLLSMFKALRNLTLAHIQCYREIHRIRAERRFSGPTMVGLAHHLRIFDPEDDKFLNKIPAKLIQYLSQDLFLESMGFGRYGFPLGLGGYPLGRGKYYDFLGINYYSRDMVRLAFEPANMFGSLTVKKAAPVNDLGWEIYPEGLYRLCRKYFAKYQAPIYITENGVCDEGDTMRSRFIYDHLQQIARLNREGIPVERYYHWSLIDNFEWTEGESGRFGLVANDFETQQRTLRKSGEFYGEICEKKIVTREMIKKYFTVAT
ncbi:MAG TPA: glycoside hydrolase family 1 protein [Firmicutes bacterium]|nr:glycoside hydrolase family 1 protein [Bacillota bacterium]